MGNFKPCKIFNVLLREEYKITLAIFSDFHKLLVAGGKKKGSIYVADVEIIDLSNPDSKCLAVPLPRWYREGILGCNDGSGNPLICGGTYISLSYNDTMSYCEELINGTWKSSKNLAHPRAYAGQSLVASGSYLITGGVDSGRKPLATMERRSENGWRVVSSNITETLYQHCQVICAEKIWMLG